MFPPTVSYTVVDGKDHYQWNCLAPSVDWSKVGDMFGRSWSSLKKTLPDAALNTPRQSLWRRLLGLMFGYDFFISYSWSDGANYAASLARQLRSQGFEVFFDRDDYASGDDWKKVGAWKLRRTGQLVLVGSPAALLSAPVIREVQIFSGTQRRIVPIDFDGTLEWKADDAPLAQYLPAEILRIREPAAALKSGPSDQVVATIRRSFNLVRQDKKRVNLSIAVAGFFAVLAAIAFFQFVQATLARSLAEEQRDKARRDLDQIRTVGSVRVRAFVERAETATKREGEIDNIVRADPGGLPDIERVAGLLKSSRRYRETDDFSAALRAGQEAITLLGTANNVAQTGPDYRLAKADAYECVGLARAGLGQFTKAKEDLATRLELLQGLMQEMPQTAKLHDSLADTIVSLGDVTFQAAQQARLPVSAPEFEEAGRYFDRAIKLRSEGPELETSPEARRLLGVAYQRLADLLCTRKKYHEADDTSGRSISMLEPLRTEKVDPPLLRQLSAAYHTQAQALVGAGNPSLALSWRDKDLAMIKGLAARQPDESEWQHDLVLSLDARGQTLQALKQHESALREYEEAIAAGEALKARSHIPPDWPRDTARAVGHRVRLLLSLGRATEALKDARRMVDILQQLASSSLDIVGDKDMADAYRLMRTALLASNRPADALDTAEQQLLAMSLAAERETRDLDSLATVLSSVSWTALLAGDIQRANLAAQQAIALKPAFPGARLNYAHALMYAGNLADARKRYLDGLNTSDESAAADWRKHIHDDFTSLSQRNLRHPLMTEIEREIGQ